MTEERAVTSRTLQIQDESLSRENPKRKPDFGLDSGWGLGCLFVSVSPCGFSGPPAVSMAGWRRANPSPLPSFRASKPDTQLIFISPAPLIRHYGTARHIASPWLAVWAKPCLEPGSFQPRVTPPKLRGALCWSNKEQTQAWQALMS